MKKYFLESIILVVFSLLSCTKDAPKANDETKDKGHDEIKETVLRITEGEEIKESNNAYFSSVKVDKEENEKLKIPIVQERVFTDIRGKGVEVNDKSPILLVRGKAYSIELFHYNFKKEFINYEFVTPQMAPIHQHFFIPEKIESIKDGVEKGRKDNVISYHYRDTKPYDKMLGEEGVRLRAENDPIGLKGYFTVNKAYQKFNLKIELAHLTEGAKLDEGKPVPYYLPEAFNYINYHTTDFKQPIPVKVFTSEESPNYKKELSKEYGISLEEVDKELSKREEIFKKSPKIKI